ncbi:MAG: hypothetical protein KJ058_18405, partial [Thermoanaerobaculia bacterium]|nr:hypothetical protein [Thermoanaerobaculia bacterium]
EREREYLTTLSFYLAGHPWLRRIVVAENSGWDLDRWMVVANSGTAGKEVEFLQLDCNSFRGDLGRGYGEGLLIDGALERSRLLTYGHGFVKLTGRQRVCNLTAVLERLSRQTSSAFDLRDHGLYERLGIPGAGCYCDTRMFIAEREFFNRELRQLYLKEPEPGHEFNLEGAYFEALRPLAGYPGLSLRFPVEPRFAGRAGHWHKDYDSPRAVFKYQVRRVLRRLFPRWWF